MVAHIPSKLVSDRPDISDPLFKFRKQCHQCYIHMDFNFKNRHRRYDLCILLKDLIMTAPYGINSVRKCHPSCTTKPRGTCNLFLHPLQPTSNCGDDSCPTTFGPHPTWPYLAHQSTMEKQVVMHLWFTLTQHTTLFKAEKS